MEIRRCTGDESRYLEELQEKWERITEAGDEEILGVGSWKPPDDSWRVNTLISKLLSFEDMEYEFIDAVERSLMSVPGVDGILEEDEGQWIVLGEPSGYDLAFAASSVVDQFADTLRNIRRRDHVGPSS